MPPTLYHVPRTISSPIVQILLELNIIDNPLVVHELAFADLKSEAHKAINPMMTSPAFVDDENHITMWESGAIIDYILETYDIEHTLWPAPVAAPTAAASNAGVDAAAHLQQVQMRAKYLQLKQYIIATVYPFIASMYIHSLRNKGELDEEYMKAAKEKCHTVLGPVMSGWLGDGPYFLGDQISAVDFLAAKPLGNVKSLGLLGEFPKLQALYERISSRPTYQAAYEPGGAATASTPPNDQTIVTMPNPKSKPTKKRFGFLSPAK